MDVHAYDAQADTISLDDITSDSHNRAILRCLQRNNVINSLWIEQHDEDEDEEERFQYIPEGANDMGWLGYFVGSSVDVIEPFLRGISSNKSIQKITFEELDLLGGEMFTMLGSFFQNNYNLTTINIMECDFGDEGARLFALAIGSCTNKSLQKVFLEDNNISEEGMVDIITALSVHPHLKYLDLDGNRLRKNGCLALATLLRCSASELQKLFISRNDFGDEGIEALLPTLANCSCLQSLGICDNPRITTKGWQRLATILESPSCNLTWLGISHNNIDDDTLAEFTITLANNNTLYKLHLDTNPITAVGWKAFSNLLCNTSSVNTTFLSNHTLFDLGLSTNAIIEPLLSLNHKHDKKEVATIKILQSHEDFDMLPFFEWEFKVLPMVVNWLERASECEMPEDFEPNIEERKLSTIYQFVRGMPVLYVETRLRKELEDIKAVESQTNEELPPKLDQRRKSIMRRLGRQ